MKEYISERRKLLRISVEEAKMEYDKAVSAVRDSHEILQFHQAELNQFDLRHNIREKDLK